MKTTYQSQAADTTIEADRHLFGLLRQRTNTQRMAMTLRHTQSGLAMSLAGLKHRFGQLDQKSFARKVAQAWLGDHWPAGFEPKGDPTDWTQDSIGLARPRHIF